MENFKYFMLGLLLGYLSMIVLCVPLSIIASSTNIEGFDKVIFWAFLMGPVFGVTYTSSKGYFGRLALIVFVGGILFALLLGALCAGVCSGEGAEYSYFMVFSNAILASTGILFVYWYYCIGMGECSFVQIYLIPLGIILLTLGLFALICLAGGGVAFAISMIIAAISVITVIVLRKRNGSALD